MTSKNASQNIIYVTAANQAHEGVLHFQGHTYPCALGRTGLIDAHDKAEGDGATPRGRWALRDLLFRPDRMSGPATNLATRPLQKEDGWCDASQDTAYNQHIKHPYDASTEKLWREDHLYDLIVPLGYNDNPVVPNRGSAIFFHVLKRDPKTNAIKPTEGCVALDLNNMRDVLKFCTPETIMHIGA